MSRRGEPSDNGENPDFSYESGTGMASWLAARARKPAASDPDMDVDVARSWLPRETWEAAADDSLPAGVIAMQDDDGLWWRYPLAEYTDYREERRP